MSRGEVVYLGLGSNQGDRAAALRRALTLLRDHVTLEACSSIQETAPWGYQQQEPFLNMACRGTTLLTPEQLLAVVKEIETTMGRQAMSQRYGPRPIDVDILFYGERVVSSPTLTIPHPRLAERGFVLVPVAELSPGLRHPVLGQTVRQLLQALGPVTGIRPWGPAPC